MRLDLSSVNCSGNRNGSGNHSHRIRKLESGPVRMEDHHIMLSSVAEGNDGGVWSVQNEGGVSLKMGF